MFLFYHHHHHQHRFKIEIKIVFFQSLLLFAGKLKAESIPQIIMLTFDDAVNELNEDIYEEIFNSGRLNPNGCPILGTFYVSHEWTDYGQVQTLYSRGHEMAAHGIR